jgi:hypothetical protein
VGEQYRSWSSSLWSFLHTPVTSSHLGLCVCMCVSVCVCDRVNFLP